MDLRELQLYKLEILKDVIALCDRYGITYYLESGTLLGCIRHGGYIPWDDDIDITLLWDDYLRFLEIAEKKLPERYFVQNLWTEKHFPFIWTQIRVNHTTSMPVSLKKLDIHWGVCIDVFPMTSVYDDDSRFEKQRKALRLVRSLLGTSLMKVTGEKAHGKQMLINMLPNSLRHFIARQLLKKNAFTSKEEKKLSLMGSVDIKKRYDYAAYSNWIERPFEGIMMKIPIGYDHVLTATYGDYMTPPPPEKRGGHEMLQGKTIVDIDNDYKTYL